MSDKRLAVKELQRARQLNSGSLCITITAVAYVWGKFWIVKSYRKRRGVPIVCQDYCNGVAANLRLQGGIELLVRRWVGNRLMQRSVVAHGCSCLA